MNPKSYKHPANREFKARDYAENGEYFTIRELQHLLDEEEALDYEIQTRGMLHPRINKLILKPQPRDPDGMGSAGGTIE